MGAETEIAWCDSTWSPIRARVLDGPNAGRVGPHCERVSPGCKNCYSETFNARLLPFNGTGLPFNRQSRYLVEHFVDEKILEQPLHWRKPKRIFVESQSDLFGEWVLDDFIDRVFAVMALCPQHTFLTLTKREKRMLEYLTASREETSWMHHLSAAAYGRDYLPLEGSNAYNFKVIPNFSWPLPNVWIGVSVEDRKNKGRIDVLRQTPAALRFLSLEPLLEDLGELDLAGISLCIIGGESGPGARPCDVAWIRSIVRQCGAAGVPCFVKQMGASVTGDPEEFPTAIHDEGDGHRTFRLQDRKGGDPAEWPHDIRMREFPAVRP